MNFYAVAQDDLVFALDGPILARDLPIGETELLFVAKGKAQALKTVCGDHAEMAAVHMMSEVGDLTVPASASVLTKGGPMKADEVLDLIDDGGSPKVEAISLEEIPSRQKHGVGAAPGYRRAARCLGDAVAVPEALDIAPDLKAVLKKAGIAYELRTTDRWLILQLDKSQQRARGKRVDFSAMRNLLALCSAWDFDKDGDIVARFPIDQAEIRKELLAGLIGTQTSFKVKWLPQYSPVEARVRTDVARWQTFAPLVAASPVSPRFRLIQCPKGRPHLVVGLAMVTPFDP